MAVFRVEKSKDYTVMSNLHLKEKDMSLKAKGLLSIMLSLPDDWDYSIAGLVAICKESESAITSILTELKKFGYLQVHKLMPNETKSGRIEYVYMVFEKPTYEVLNREEYIKIAKQGGKKQGLENQGVEFLGLENQGQLNTNIYNTNNINPIFPLQRDTQLNEIDCVSETTSASNKNNTNKDNIITKPILESFTYLYNNYPCKINREKGKSLNTYYNWLHTGKVITLCGKSKKVILNHIQMLLILQAFIKENSGKDEEYIPRLSTFLGKSNITNYLLAINEQYQQVMLDKYGKDWKKIKFVYTME